MTRKRITEKYPWLLPLRQKERKLFFYLAMKFDGNHYASYQTNRRLCYSLFHTEDIIINENSGYDISYQYNKAHNLRVASKKLNGLLIRPGETFSFWHQIKNADRYEPYLEGLSLVNGSITGEYGGGLCQLSNMLYWMFLHSDLTVTERHGHGTEAVNPGETDFPVAVDATVSEGWLDLKVKNNTADTFQIVFDFDEEKIKGTLLSQSKPIHKYQIYNKNLRYISRNGIITEETEVWKKTVSSVSNEEVNSKLYDNSCVIEYPLPQNVRIENM